MKLSILNRQGFTLLEIIAVLLIVAVLAALAIPRYVDLDISATSRAIDAGISELNAREAMIWSDIKLSQVSYNESTGDDDVWAVMKNDSTNSYPDLGPAYQWITMPDQAGGEISFKGRPVIALYRTASTLAQPAHWSD